MLAPRECGNNLLNGMRYIKGDPRCLIPSFPTKSQLVSSVIRVDGAEILGSVGSLRSLTLGAYRIQGTTSDSPKPWNPRPRSPKP